jgi:two-component system response regulator GlrR
MAEDLPQTEALDGYALEQPLPELRPSLTWIDGGDTRTVAIEERIVVGSSPSAGVVLSDRTVSRLHAELALRANGLWVRDLESRNGTFVENVRVAEALVPDGASLRLGRTVLRVAYGAPSAPDVWERGHFGPLLGASVAMRKLFALLARVAATEASVLVQGETGTGKELVAEAIHAASGRADGPLVVVDCAGLPEALLESELFGHARGAFTGAVEARVGAIEAAAGGTLFLDEIGELSLAMQPKLLRVLESRTIRRIGETQHRKVDVRVVAATHRDLLTMVGVKAFREDLYFRLAVLPVVVPPLRERRGDIPVLLDGFLKGRARALLRAEQLATVQSWPLLGNVRELRNFAERVATVGAETALAMADPARKPDAPEAAPASPGPFPKEGRRGGGSADDASLPDVPFEQSYRDFREQLLAAAEREYLRRLLTRHAGDVPAAALEAEIDRTHLYRLLRKHRV